MRRAAVLGLVTLAALAVPSLADDALEDLESAIEGAGDRARATEALAAVVASGVATRRTADVLLDAGAVVESADFYAACTGALAGATGEARDAVVDALDDRRWQRRVVAVDALGRAGDPDAVAAIATALRHDDRRPVLVAAARALARAHRAEGVAPLLRFVKEREERSDSFQAVAEAREALALLGAPAGARAAEEGAPARLGGRDVRSNAVIAVLDAARRAPGDERPPALVAALDAFVASLDEATRFALVAPVGSSVRSWPSPAGLRLATPEAKAAARAWLATVVPGTEPQPAESLLHALREDVDTICFASDVRADALRASVVRYDIARELARRGCRLRKITVHALALADAPPELASFLDGLAREQGGSLATIPSPPR